MSWRDDRVCLLVLRICLLCLSSVCVVGGGCMLWIGAASQTSLDLWIGLGLLGLSIICALAFVIMALEAAAKKDETE